MTNEERVNNVVKMTETLWNARRYDVLRGIEALDHRPVPEDCEKLIETAFRLGAVNMLRQLEHERRNK
jgi:hypothetical protein